jgi:ABC-type uncharacterized transport system permease subunit
MNWFVKYFWKAWKDPVWSKVISTGLIALIVLIPISFLWNNVLSILRSKIELWIVFIILIILTVIQFLIKYLLSSEKEQDKQIYSNVLNKISDYILF